MNASWQAASQDIYQAQQEGNAEGATADAGGAENEGDAASDVTQEAEDVEFEEVDDKA